MMGTILENNLNNLFKINFNLFQIVMDKNTKLYQDLSKLYSSAHPGKARLACQVEVNEIWKTKIKEGKKKVDTAAYELEVDKLKTKMKKREAEGGISSFFKKKSGNDKSQQVEQQKQQHSAAEVQDAETVTIPDEPLEGEEGEESQYQILKPEPHPAQDKLKEELSKVEKMLANLIETRDLGMQESSASSLTKQIKEIRALKENLEKMLKRKLINQKAQQKQRLRKREEQVKIKETYPELAA